MPFLVAGVGPLKLHLWVRREHNRTVPARQSFYNNLQIELLRPRKCEQNYPSKLEYRAEIVVGMTY